MEEYLVNRSLNGRLPACISQTGHLVHVAVTMLDVNERVVEKLGLLDSWTCTASLILDTMQTDRYSICM